MRQKGIHHRLGITVLASTLLVGAVGASARAGAARPGYITGTAKTECGLPLPVFTVAAFGFDGNVNVNPQGLPFLGQAVGHGGRYALQTRDSIHSASRSTPSCARSRRR